MGDQLPLPVPSIHSGSSPFTLSHLRHDITLLPMLVFVGVEVLGVVPLSAWFPWRLSISRVKATRNVFMLTLDTVKGPTMGR